MIHHISLHAGDYARSKAFLESALKPLGYSVIKEFSFPGGSVCGMGADGKPDLWLSQKETAGPAHIAFAAPDRKAVDEFYKAALAAGGKDNGAPGIRADYSPTYYAAFVLDPDGNNIEAVCFEAE